MSRCFPFPPPGYEKKPITEDPDLLKKEEKRREKKHKKDKKEKEKKDGKEKKEKNRSEGKHKEKKDKHRDKKKDKEKSETSTPDKTNIYAQPKGYNGERLHQKNSADGKKPLTQFPQQNGDLLRNKITVGDAENYKFVQELDRRIRDEEKGMGSQRFAVEGRKSSFNNVEMQKTDGRQVVMDVAGFSGNVAVPNRINGATPPPWDNRRIEKMQEKGSDDKRGDKRKIEDRDRQKQGNDKEMEKEKRLEKLKEKSEQKKGERAKNKYIMNSDFVVPNNSSIHLTDNGFLGVGNEGIKKRKDIETNGASHENELRPNKMARPGSNISPENGRKYFSQSLGPTLLDKQGASQNSLKVGSNGGQRVNGMTTSQPVSIPAKKPPIFAAHNVPPKPSPIKSPPVIINQVSAQSPLVSTTKPQPNHIAAQLSTPKPPPSIPNPITSHNQLPSVSSPPPPPPVSRPKPPPAVVNKVTPPPKKKSPHPDTKYLNQILSVPKPDQWCSLDDQEWLYSSKAGRPTSKKPPTDDLEVQVWSEAKHIESVDVYALPYVIPY